MLSSYTITSVGLRSHSYEQVAFLASIHKPLHFQRKIPTNFVFFKVCMSTALHYDTSKKTKLSKYVYIQVISNIPAFIVPRFNVSVGLITLYKTSDRYQHRLQIYHFTVGRLSSLALYRYCKRPTAIGAVSAYFG